LGRVHIYILRISGVPAAADIWFRIGDVATCYSGAYDQQFAAASPGTILSWWGQESIFSESPPAIIDFLSGQNPQKDSLCPDQQPLVLLEAARKSVVTRITFPLRRQIKRLRRGLAYRLHRKKAQKQVSSQCSSGRMVVFNGSGEVLPAALLVLDEKLEFYLTLAVGQGKTKSMIESWVEGDEWWRVGEQAIALVRLGKVERENRPVREVIVFGEGTEEIEIILHSLAASLGTSISARIPDDKAEGGEDAVPLHRTLLPFPG